MDYDLFQETGYLLQMFQRNESAYERTKKSLMTRLANTVDEADPSYRKELRSFCMGVLATRTTTMTDRQLPDIVVEAMAAHIGSPTDKKIINVQEVAVHARNRTEHFLLLLPARPEELKQWRIF